MSKILATVGALALAATLALPAAANAAERKADGLRADAAGMTDVSSYHRRWHRRHVVVRRGFYHRPYWRGRYAYGYYRPFYRRAYVGYPYWRPYRPYYAGFYRPWYHPWYGPRLAFGIGFGPRWW
jgi:hypothetical protein